ncbi:MAG: DNA-processing protein DprA, partial [Thermomicrobiales bacterium]
ARWLQSEGHSCLELLEQPARILEGWEDRRITNERVMRLLDRGTIVDRKIESWRGSGVWIVGRADADYPQLLKRRLEESRPPVLFGIGNPLNLDRDGTAIVGSRDATMQTLRIAETLGMRAAREGKTVISGGAHGIDERAVQGAFLAGGNALVVLGDSLLKNAQKNHYEEFLENGALTLVSSYSPDVGFTAGNAMGRNRLIYCLAEDAIVVASVNGIGGTFGGAQEAVRRGWGKIWVVPTGDPRSGNPLLVENPDQWLPESAYAEPASMYGAFLAGWRRTGTAPLTIDELANTLDLVPEQVHAWIADGRSAGHIQQDAATDRYVLAGARAQEP